MSGKSKDGRWVQESVMMDLSHNVLLKHGGIAMNPPLTVLLKLLESYRVKRCSHQCDFSSVCAASCQLSLSSVTIRPRPAVAGSSHGPDGGSSFSGTAHWLPHSVRRLGCKSLLLYLFSSSMVFTVMHFKYHIFWFCLKLLPRKKKLISFYLQEILTVQGPCLSWASNWAVNSS